MKFFKTIPLICTFISSLAYAEKASGVDDIFSELASRKTTQEELKDNPEYQQEAVLRNTTTPSFLIVGEDSFGFSQIREIIICAEGVIQEHLGLKINPKSKINLKVIPFTDEKYDKQFYIENNNTSINLMLRWDDKLEYDAFCKFIMGAMLRKIAQDRNLNAEDGYELPYFLELSLSMMLQEKAKGRASVSLAKKASETELLSLKDSFEISRATGDIEQKELSAYWNLVAINRFIKDKKQLQELFRNYLSKPKEFNIHENISKLYNAGDIDNYFKCIVYYELSSRTGGVMTMEESAEELLRLSFLRKDSINIALGDKDILKFSNDKEVATAIARRITEIKLLLTKINPIYFNTLLALGEMFESALRTNESDFEEARLAFINEFRYSNYMQGRAKALLNKEQTK